MTSADEYRRTRFTRRQTSTEWLIREARREAGLPVVAEVGTRAGDEGWVRPPRPARCRWRVAEMVGVHAPEDGGQGTAHFSGTERCGSIWACPVCSAVIRAERAAEIQRAVTAHQAAGGSLVFVTLTVRHRSSDALAVSLDAVLTAWRRMIRGKGWTLFCQRYGVEGYIRAVEVTHGENGWHPHVHALFFTARPLTTSEVKAWESEMFGRWADFVTKAGARTPTKLRGIDVRPADESGRVVAQYLAKLQEHGERRRHEIGSELARFDNKTGRAGSLMPFELLDDHRGDEDDDYVAARVRLWWEYVTTTRGRRAITWSKGLKARLLPDEDEKTDDEILDEAERAPLRLLVPPSSWCKVQNEPAVMAAGLEALERGDVATAAFLLGAFEPDRDTADSVSRHDALAFTEVMARHLDATVVEQPEDFGDLVEGRRRKRGRWGAPLRGSFVLVASETVAPGGTLFA